MTDIGGGLYMKKSDKGIPPLNRSKLSKKHKKSRIKSKNIFLNLLSGGMLGDSNYIGTSLNGWIQKLSPKGINHIQFIRKSFI